MNKTLTIDMTGPAANYDKLLKKLKKVKAEFTQMGQTTDDDGKETYSVQFLVKSKKFWKVHHKIKGLGNLTIG